MQTGKSFADDLELALDCRTQHVVVQVVIETASGGEAADPLGGSTGIP
ncbi:MAG TPA: hypothetical protein VMI30_07385 [Stellaceae bacterium]|nr:hypothetical protein [Stellaceae bacterium]